MTERTVAQALTSALDLALEHDDVVLLGEDVGATGGAAGVEIVRLPEREPADHAEGDQRRPGEREGHDPAHRRR